MKKVFSGKIKLMLSVAVCLLFIAISFSSATVKSADIQANQTKKDSDPVLPKNPRVLSLFNFRILNLDWNYWDNKPNLFLIPTGNVGIGTSNPLAKLDVFGNIAIKGKVVINESGNWVGNLSGMQGPPGPQGPQGIPGDSRWGLNGMNIYYTNGSVGIGTKNPSATLDVNGTIIGKFLVSDMDFVWESSGYITAIMGAVEPSTNKIYVRTLENFNFGLGHLDNSSLWRNWTDFGNPDSNQTIEDLTINLKTIENTGYYSGLIVIRMSSGDIYLCALENFNFGLGHLDNSSLWRNWTDFGSP